MNNSNFSFRLIQNIIIFSLISIVADNNITAQEKRESLTLNAYLTQLKEKHPFFVKEELKSEIEKEQLAGLTGAEDWKVVSSFGYSTQEPAINFSGPDRTDALSFTGGIERTFWATGGRLSASFSTTSLSFTLPALPEFSTFPTDWYQSQFDLTYIHPILKNRSGFLDKLQHKLQEFDVDISEVTKLENEENFLLSASTKYLTWVFLSEQLKIIDERLALSESEMERTRRKRSSNLVEKVDVLRAEDAVRIAKQNKMLTESQINGLKAEIAILTQLPEINNSSPDFNLYTTKNIEPLESETSALKKNSRLVKTLQMRINQINLARSGFEETAKPELAFVAQVSTKSFEEDFGGSLTTDKRDALLGLQFSLPLGNRTANSGINKSRLQISQIEYELSDLVLQLTASLSRLHIQMEKMKEVLELNQEQISSAQEKTAEEIKLYNQGRGDLTFVIQSRDNEQNAKLLYAVNALTYQNLLIQYRALMDDLL